MEQELFKLAVSQGPFAALFVALLFWVLRENAKREDRLMSFFDEISDKLGTIQTEQQRGFADVLGKLDRVLNCVKED